MLQSVLQLLYQTVSIHRPVNEAVNVGALVCSCEQIVKFPEVDVAAAVFTKALIPVVVFDHRTNLLIPKQ
jgi:hypothetical protein